MTDEKKEAYNPTGEGRIFNPDASVNNESTRVIDPSTPKLDLPKENGTAPIINSGVDELFPPVGVATNPAVGPDPTNTRMSNVIHSEYNPDPKVSVDEKIYAPGTVSIKPDTDANPPAEGARTAVVQLNPEASNPPASIQDTVKAVVERLDTNKDILKTEEQALHDELANALGNRLESNIRLDDPYWSVRARVQARLHALKG